jgi:hypothetical protein
MAAKTVSFGAIDQTADPLCDKIAPTEAAISIDLPNYAPLWAKIQNGKLAQANFFASFLERVPRREH